MRYSPRHYHPRNTTDDGFTLAELLVVVVVLGIIALVVMPTVYVVDDTRLAEAGRLLVADLDNARLQSMGSAADPCLVVFDPSGSSYFLSRKSDPTNPIVDPGSGRPWRRAFGRGSASQLDNVTVALAGGVAPSLSFTGLGTITPSLDAELTLRCKGRSITIVVDARTGSSRIRP
jgi:prepilin-type N-terminal cleavage/methylation domain-containing protein